MEQEAERKMKLAKEQAERGGTTRLEEARGELEDLERRRAEASLGRQAEEGGRAQTQNVGGPSRLSDETADRENKKKEEAEQRVRRERQERKTEDLRKEGGKA
eukprot:2254572-Rhodomonas_salina.1